jgi:hypothetical protein
MALPMPPPPILGPMNPLETFLVGFNTNTYFIGFMMLLLNLGGRHLAGGLTPEQDKIFQNPWIRRGLLFVVIFVATRNIFTALWMSIGIILILGYLTNETSNLYLFGKPKIVEAVQQPAGLTPDEQAIFKSLQDKTKRAEPAPAEQKSEGFDLSYLNSYQNSMRIIQSS